MSEHSTVDEHSTRTSSLKPVLRRLHRAVRLVFGPVAIACLFGFGWHSRSLLEETLRTANIRYLLLAILTWSLMNLIAPLLSVMIFRGRGFHLSYQLAARIHISNLPARYIPGGIWHTVGRVLDFRKAGIGKADLAAFLLLENALAAALAFVMGGSVLFLYRGPQGWGLVAGIAAVLAAFLLISLPFLTRFRKSVDEPVPPVRYYLSAVLIVAVSWCIAATAFVTFARGFAGLSRSVDLLEMAATYLFSWAIGFVALFAPQGVGVFEVVAADLLRGAAPLTGIAALLATFRLVILVSDVFVWLLPKALPGRKRQHSDPGSKQHN